MGTQRVLFLSTDMGMGGGAEEQVIRLAYAFHSRGWETCIVSLVPPSPMPADFDGRGISLLHLDMRRGIPNPRSLWRFARILRDFRPHVVHSHMTHANLLARIVRIFQPYPVLVCTLHAMNMAGVERGNGKLLETAHRLTDSLADRTTAICDMAAKYYVQCRAVSASRMLLLHNGIDTDRYAPQIAVRNQRRSELQIDGNQFVWLAVGRLEQVKAYPTLLNAFAKYRIQCSGERPVLLICGQGSLLPELVLLARHLNISENVRFLGLRSDVADVMSAADAFALSSDMEGLPLVLLQASAASLPIVATDVGGNSEAVVHGVTGFVVPPGNPELFAREMVRVSAMSPSERAKVGAAGQARIRELFEAERIADKWERLFTQLLDAVGGVANCEARRRAQGAAS